MSKLNYFIAFACLFALSACSFQSSSTGNTSQQSVAGTPPATSPEIPQQVSSDNIERFYVVHGRRYGIMKSSQGFSESGTASWYGDPFHGRKTSNGETYDMYQMSAAHKHLPLPTFVEVTNTLNGKRVVLRVNDRGPFVGDRVIDLSFAAAKELDIIQSGTGPVHVRALDELNQTENNSRLASPDQPAFIQVASFKEHNNAFNYQKRLINNGISNSRIIQIKDESGSPLLRVQIGPLNNGTEYDLVLKKLRKIGIVDTILVNE